MKLIALTTILLGWAAFAPPALASICSLPPATDSFASTEGAGTILLPGFPGPLPFFVCGPTSITRGSPADNGDGSCTIPTEIVSMTLTGVFDPCGLNTPIRIIEDSGMLSTGSVKSNTAGDLPGYSFFDVFTRVDIPGLAIFGMPHFVHVVAHSEKLAGDDSLNHLPPGASTPGGPECVEPGDDYYAAGYPDDHEHIPCPPKACCRLECGALLKVSPRTCQRFNGTIVDHCTELCAGQPTLLTPRSWGRLKLMYR